MSRTGRRCNAGGSNDADGQKAGRHDMVSVSEYEGRPDRLPRDVVQCAGESHGPDEPGEGLLPQQPAAGNRMDPSDNRWNRRPAFTYSAGKANPLPAGANTNRIATGTFSACLMASAYPNGGIRKSRAPSEALRACAVQRGDDPLRLAGARHLPHRGGWVVPVWGCACGCPWE